MYQASVINSIAVGDILRRAASNYPEQICLIENDQKLTYKETNELANQFANYLLSKGLKKGDTVATICVNSIEFVIMIFGIAKAGLVWVPINPGISLDDKQYILNETKVKL